MKNTKNPIAQMADTLANPKKPSKAVVMLSPEKTLECVSSYTEGYKLGMDSIALMNKALKPFHDAKVKLCKASEKSSPLYAYSNQVRTMFVDSMKAVVNPKTGKALTQSYIDKMLYPAFLRGVNNGSEISVINTAQAKAKGKDSKAKGKGKKEPAIDVLIAKVFTHKDFKTLNEDLKIEIKAYLEQNDYELTE